MRSLLSLCLIPALVMASACKEESKVSVAAGLRPDTMPTMSTVNVSTLISDSGITQYKIVAPVWKVYDEAKEPYWIFPKGVYLQKYDRKLKVIATVAADSAKYFKNKKLWRLDGNVEIRKVPKELFYTQQVYWDQNRRIIYSDSFIHIENPTHVLEGHGFISDEMFTRYTVRRPQGIFPMNPDNMRSPDAATPAVAAASPGTPPAGEPMRHVSSSEPSEPSR